MEHKNGNEKGNLVRNAALETADSDLVLKNCQEQQLIQTQAELCKALEEVKRAEAEFSSAFEFAPIGMALVNTSCVFLRVNKRFCQLLEYSIEEMQQLTFADITHKQDLETSIHYYNQLMRGEMESYHLEKRYITKSRMVVWVSLSVSLIREVDGSPKHTVVQIMDVTKNIAYQEALRKSEKEAKKLAKHYKSLLDNQSVYIVKTDASGRYTYVNDYFRKRFGFSSAILGKCAIEHIIDEDKPACILVAKKCLSEPEVSHGVILKTPVANGSIIGGKWELKGILNKVGHVNEILCVGFDITEQLEILEKTRHLLEITSEQNLKLKRFAQIVSHNLRSHSANFSGLLSMLDEATEDEKHTYISLLKQSADHLEQTIQNLNQIITIRSQNI